MAGMSDSKTVLKNVIKALGGPQSAAASLGVGLSAVQHWQALPTKHIPKVSMLTGMTAEQLRPDLATAA